MKSFDTAFLSLLMVPNARAPRDPATGKPIERAQERIEELVRLLDEQNEKILIPAPALSEFLVLAAEAGPQYLAELNMSSVFRVVDFDQRAAIEAAALTIEAKRKGGKQEFIGTREEIKFDRQIVACAKVNGADEIYSTDADVAKIGAHAKIQVRNIHDLPPAPAKQMDMNYEQDRGPAESETADVPRSGDGLAEGPAAAEGKKTAKPRKPPQRKK